MAGKSSTKVIQERARPLDFTKFPPIFVLPTHMDEDGFDAIVDKLEDLQAPHTYDMTEAKLVLGRITKKRRAEYELRCRKLWTEEVKRSNSEVENSGVDSLRSSKRRKVESSTAKPGGMNSIVLIDDSSTESEAEGEAESEARENPETVTRRSNSRSVTLTSRGSQTEQKIPLASSSSTESEHGVEPDPEPITGEPGSRPSTTSPVTLDFQADPLVPFSIADLFNSVKVIKIDWLEDSLKSQRFLPLDSYIIYEGKRIARPTNAIVPPLDEPKRVIKPFPPKPRSSLQPNVSDIPEANKAILERALADVEARLTKRDRRHIGAGQDFKDRTFSSSSQRHRHAANQSTKYAAHLLHQTTTEHDSGISSELPEMPDWVKQNLKYACERSTPGDGPNHCFMVELKKIKLARVLTADEIGVRAYSTSIASIAAYPYPITSPREIVELPGCDVKIANLWVEFKNTGHIEAADDAENDEALSVLRLFYDIWGVGATTAREFYYDRGWRELDDVVEYGWNTLNREQQIGVKYYEEFLDKIPRAEVEQIAHTIHDHAVLVRDDNIQSLVVGGYRRGKDASGDVDIIVSHPNQEQTLNIIHDIVASLETGGWITHTLQLKLTNSNRGQSTLPYRTGGGGHGFDSLDKALVVWQNLSWPTQSQDLAANPRARNPNPHRRVDIIVSPWRTVGCAVMGWTGGTTFQRDLRRYAKYVKGWKFDSSGVRDRQTGRAVDLEGEGGTAKSMVEAERKVFEGLGLVYREPWERCTG